VDSMQEVSLSVEGHNPPAVFTVAPFLRIPCRCPASISSFTSPLAVLITSFSSVSRTGPPTEHRVFLGPRTSSVVIGSRDRVPITPPDLAPPLLPDACTPLTPSPFYQDDFHMLGAVTDGFLLCQKLRIGFSPLPGCTDGILLSTVDRSSTPLP